MRSNPRRMAMLLRSLICAGLVALQTVAWSQTRQDGPSVASGVDGDGGVSRSRSVGGWILNHDARSTDGETPATASTSSKPVTNNTSKDAKSWVARRFGGKGSQPA